MSDDVAMLQRLPLKGSISRNGNRYVDVEMAAGMNYGLCSNLPTCCLLTCATILTRVESP